MADIIYIENYTVNNHNHVDTAEIISLLNILKLKLHKMAQNDEKALEDLEAIKTNIAKIGSETGTLLTKITELEQVIANNSGTPQAVLDKIAEVKAAAVAVDDLVPDAPPVEPPVEG